YRFVTPEWVLTPPPKLISIILGVTDLLDLTLSFVFAGVHRQALLASIGWFIGYHVTKRENYTYARLDRDMNEYVRLHPENFSDTEKKTFAEIVEPFHPIR
uniref:NADH:ubiquinone oxidoreductase subunit C2 n=1 Tax=Hucho hucho TaxID=62062 RepID=A0A4W5LEP2_9TELE